MTGMVYHLTLSETTWENVTVYYLDMSDYKITAYGYAEP
jgi:hypothetical protein